MVKKNMIVAITGGTGFIGRRLVERHLALGDQVRILSRHSPKDVSLPDYLHWYKGDLIDGENLQTFVDGVDVLYHCAGEIQNPSMMESLHISGTNCLIKVAAGRIGRWVQLSSTGAYGGHIREGIVTEQTSLNPVGMYEITKVKSDQLVINASLNGAFDYVVLRPSIVYGPKMPNQSLYALISMIKRGLFFFVGKPGASANYIHVNNVVDALVLCGSLPQASGQIYNLSDYCTIEDFVASIAEELHCSVPHTRFLEPFVRMLARFFWWIPRMPLTKSRIDALTTRVQFSINKIESDLGYKHSLTMREGLKDLVADWRSRNQSQP